MSAGAARGAARRAARLLASAAVLSGLCGMSGCSGRGRGLEVELRSQRAVAAGELCLILNVDGRSSSHPVAAIAAAGTVRMTLDTLGEGAGVVIRPCAAGAHAPIFSEYVEPRQSVLRIDLSRLPRLPGA